MKYVVAIAFSFILLSCSSGGSDTNSDTTSASLDTTSTIAEQFADTTSSIQLDGAGKMRTDTAMEGANVGK